LKTPFVNQNGLVNKIGNSNIEYRLSASGVEMSSFPGRDISGLELYEIREVLTRNGETVNLDVMRDGKPILLSLLLRSLY
jgi:hypothetical protein